MATNPKSQTRKTLPIDLALQGGGSHGAFTWGVLDRILEEDWFEIDGISGTSAGAMNAAILAAGMATGGRQTAREMLTAFWRRTADAARFSPFKRGPLEVLTGKWTLDNSPRLHRHGSDGAADLALFAGWGRQGTRCATS
jgi:NTE family protein